MKKAPMLAAAGLVTASLGMMSPALAHTDPYPESEGYYQVNDRFTLAAGEACDRPVIVTFTGYERDILNGKDPLPDGYDLQPGDTLDSVFPEQEITVINKRDRSKRITRPTDGPSREHVRRNGVDADVFASGNNVYFDRGVKGIIWNRGDAAFVIKNFDDPDSRRLKFKRPLTGPTQELCGAVGLRPVDPAQSQS